MINKDKRGNTKGTTASSAVEREVIKLYVESLLMYHFAQLIKQICQNGD